MSSYGSLGGSTSSSIGSASAASAPIYHDHSPSVVLAGKAFGLVTVVMVIIAVIISILEVQRNWSFSLLVINLVISSVATSFLVWWYRKGVLAPNKMWFLFVIAGILVFQCLSTIIYVTTHKTYDEGKKFIPAFTPVTPVTIKTPPSHIEMTQGDLQYVQVPHS